VEQVFTDAAFICLARRRVDVMHAMLCTGTAYQHKTAEKPHCRHDQTHRDPRGRGSLL
jgi:hypothetical protein